MAIENFDQVTIEPAKLRPFNKFIMSIGELPTSYLDSLSYAEQVTWFCDYLQNHVIPAVNNNAAALEEVQNLMTQLQEYVDNYFTNLDVQEEINNKLDEMALSGELTNLIKDYVDPIYTEFENTINTTINELDTKVDSLASGSPLVASSTAGMTDTDRVYVNTTDGKWYYYNGTDWTIGGTYQSTGLADSSVSYNNLDDELKYQVDELYANSPNLYNLNTALLNKNIITWSTTLTTSNYTYDSNTSLSSAPIPCDPETEYFIYYLNNEILRPGTFNNVIFFNEDGTYNDIYVGSSGVSISSITTPENCKYFAFGSGGYASIYDKIMITKGAYTGQFQLYGRRDKKYATKEELNDILKDLDKTHILFSFDQFAIDNRFTLMKQYNFPFTIALSGQAITKEQYYEYFIDGNVDFSIYGGSGSMPEDYTDGQEQWNTWVKNLTDTMQNTYGLYYPVMYSCVNNKTSEILNNACKNSGFKMCRATDYVNSDGTTTYMSLTKGHLFKGIDDYNYVPLFIYNNNFNLATIQSEINKAIYENKSIMLFTHLVKNDDDPTMTDYDTSLTNFTNVLNYVKQKVDSGLCDVLNTRQYYNLYANSDINFKRTNMRNYFDNN